MQLLANLFLTGVFLLASSRNYPGGDALGHLQVKFDVFSGAKHCSIFIVYASLPEKSTDLRPHRSVLRGDWREPISSLVFDLGVSLIF